MPYSFVHTTYLSNFAYKRMDILFTLSRYALRATIGMLLTIGLFSHALSNAYGSEYNRSHSVADAPPTYLSTDLVTSEAMYEPVFNAEAQVYTKGDPSKPALLLVHGIGESGADVWRELLPILAKHHYVVAVDLPGFGRSSQANELYSPANYSQFIEYVKHQKLADRPFTLAGHSMGGATALYYAAHYPKQLEKLVIIDAAGMLHRSQYAAYLSQLGIPNDMFGAEIGQSVLNGIIGSILSEAELIQNIDLERLLNLRSLRSTILRSDPSAIAGAALIATDFSAELRQISIPTLIIWGENDSIAPPRSGVMLHGVLANSQLVNIKNAAHVPMLDAPEQVAAHMLLFTQHGIIDKPSSRQAISSAKQTTNNNDRRDHNDRCNNSRQYTFSGHYQHIEIVNCNNVVLDQVTATSVRIINSDVHIVNSNISHNAGTALDVTTSNVAITGSLIQGKTAILTSSSDWDIYGTTLMSNSTIMQSVTGGRSKVVFSVSQIKERQQNRYAHEVVQLSGTERL